MKQLYTRWGKNLDTKNILPEHPNPLCRREHFTILNGTPDFATCFILTIEKNVENTALGLYFL